MSPVTAGTARPSGDSLRERIPSLEMEMRDVFFANYPVDPDVVTPHLPDRLSVDTFDGDAYLSIVALQMVNVRPARLPAAVGLTMPDLNLRTYVTCDDGGRRGGDDRTDWERGGRPGIYFFSLDVGSALGTLGGRVSTRFPYFYADVDYQRGPPTRFESRRRTPGARPATFAATYEPAGDAFRPTPGTVDHFLVERYCSVTMTQAGGRQYLDLDHEPWTLRPASWTVEENTLFEASGFDVPESEPILRYSYGHPAWAGTRVRE